MKDAQKTSLRVVLDTNVYISEAYLGQKKKTGNLWLLAIERRYALVVSPFIIHEFMEKLREKFGASEDERESIKKKLAKVAEIVRPEAETVSSAIPDDPDDNHILACALAGKADLIVSGDRHLLTLKEYEGIPIVRPMDFLRTLGHS